MSGIVLDLQEELLNNSAPLSQLMAKAYVVARKLGLKQWIELFYGELYGHTNSSNLPSYRKIRGVLQAKEKNVLFSNKNQWTDVKHKLRLGRNMYNTEQETITHDTYTKLSVYDLERYLSTFQDITEPILSPYGLIDVNLSGNRFNYDYRVNVPASSINLILHNMRLFLIEWTLSLSEQGIFGNGLEFNKEETQMAQTINAQNVWLQNQPINSTQNTTININQSELFDQIIEKTNALNNKDDILKAINEMKTALEDKQPSSFMAGYTSFVGAVADHMTIFAPFFKPLLDCIS